MYSGQELVEQSGMSIFVTLQGFSMVIGGL